MKKGLSELVFIVDRSGSMGGLESDTIGGINATLAKHRDAEGEAIVSIVLFNHSADVLVDRVPIAEVKDLATDDYCVGGCTALLDSVGGSIHHIDRVQRYMPDEYKAEHVIFVITTDGLENASTHFTYEQVKHAIEAHTEQGWEFLFLGANIDAIAEASRLGIHADYAAQYVSDKAGSAIAYEGIADATVCMRQAPLPGKLGGGWKRRIMRDTAKRG